MGGGGGALHARGQGTPAFYRSATKRERERKRGPHVTRATSTSEDTPPDWGGEEEDSSPDGQDKEQAAGAQWPWGPAGRPSDQDAEQQRPNEPVGGPPRKPSCSPTDRPNEPAGEPPVRPKAGQHVGRGTSDRGGEVKSHLGAKPTLASAESPRAHGTAGGAGVSAKKFLQ